MRTTKLSLLLAPATALAVAVPAIALSQNGAESIPQAFDNLADSAPAVAILVAAGSEIMASVEASAIASDTEGAMLPPRRWSCDIYVDEYRDWLDEGNAREDWRFEGKTYRDVETAELYNTDTWRAWLADSECPGMPAAEDEVAAAGMGSLLPILGGTTAAAAAGAAMGGGGADSPG